MNQEPVLTRGTPFGERRPGDQLYFVSDISLASEVLDWRPRVRVVVGDSWVIQADTGDVDLVVIDTDHSYDAVKDDFERWGRRVRVGDHVMLGKISKRVSESQVFHRLRACALTKLRKQVEGGRGTCH